METLMSFLIGCVVLGFILIWYISVYNRFQEYNIRINEAEANIDSTLRKRFDLIKKAKATIKANIELDDAFLDKVESLKDKKLSNFDLDRELYDLINELQTTKEQYPALNQNDAFLKIMIELNESETEIGALRRYYNDIITDYNHLGRAFPSNVVALISHFKQRPYFDGKNMNDEKIDDFKL